MANDPNSIHALKCKILDNHQLIQQVQSLNKRLEDEQKKGEQLWERFLKLSDQREKDNEYYQQQVSELKEIIQNKKKKIASFKQNLHLPRQLINDDNNNPNHSQNNFPTISLPYNTPLSTAPALKTTPLKPPSQRKTTRESSSIPKQSQKIKGDTPPKRRTALYSESQDDLVFPDSTKLRQRNSLQEKPNSNSLQEKPNSNSLQENKNTTSLKEKTNSTSLKPSTSSETSINQTKNSRLTSKKVKESSSSQKKNEETPIVKRKASLVESEKAKKKCLENPKEIIQFLGDCDLSVSLQKLHRVPNSELMEAILGSFQFFETDHFPLLLLIMKLFGSQTQTLDEFLLRLKDCSLQTLAKDAEPNYLLCHSFFKLCRVCKNQNAAISFLQQCILELPTLHVELITELALDWPLIFVKVLKLPALDGIQSQIIANLNFATRETLDF